MQSATPQTIVVYKKKKQKGGHHGGAWKVAYADFVTAMMALFIVLWLLSSSEKVQKAVGGYFVDPTGNGKLTGTTSAGTGDSLMLGKADMENLKNKLEQVIRIAPELSKVQKQVKLSLTGEGLRVELMETDKGTFFESGNSKPNPACVTLLHLLGQELSKLSNTLVVEGHTDAKPYGAGGSYSNWDLSSDRATAALLVLFGSGIRPDQVKQVRGFADQSLLRPENPLDPSNRRVSVIVQYGKQGKEPAAPAPAH